MQHEGIYHIAPQLTALLDSSVPRGMFPGALPLDPAGGSPRPHFLERSVLFQADFQNNVRCKAIYLQ